MTSGRFTKEGQLQQPSICSRHSEHTTEDGQIQHSGIITPTPEVKSSLNRIHRSSDEAESRKLRQNSESYPQSNTEGNREHMAGRQGGLEQRQQWKRRPCRRSAHYTSGGTLASASKLDTTKTPQSQKKKVKLFKIQQKRKNLSSHYRLKPQTSRQKRSKSKALWWGGLTSSHSRISYAAKTSFKNDEI